VVFKSVRGGGEGGHGVRIGEEGAGGFFFFFTFFYSYLFFFFFKTARKKHSCRKLNNNSVQSRLGIVFKNRFILKTNWTFGAS